MTTGPRQSRGERQWSGRLVARRRLTAETFELNIERPPDFDFRPGQRIALACRGAYRDYTLVSTPDAAELVVLVRLIPGGRTTPLLDRIPIGTALDFNGPQGRFVFRPGRRPAVMVATGTGIAPFAAMIRAGVRPARLLHGVRTPDELYYRRELLAAAERYIPCLSGDAALPPGACRGYVTRVLADGLDLPGCDFYLAGRMAMIHDALAIIDDHYPTSRVYSEAFF
jgi:ferredoxin-NADP reductase